MIVRDLSTLADIADSVVVVGAGPAGIVQALELRRHGVGVTVLAGGMDGFSANFQALADAEIVDQDRHAPMQVAVRRALGGTSLLWGGRCVPFDAVDFATRPHVPSSGWPIAAPEVERWYDVAAPYLDAGPPLFSDPLAGCPEMAECRLDRLERWSNGRNLRRLHAAALERDEGLRICLGAVAVGLTVDPASGSVAGVTVALPSGARVSVGGRAFVLACGGLETTRLLLVAQTPQPGLFGGSSGVLGRYYMGHIEGRIAEILFDAPTLDTSFDFFVAPGGRYARRRLTISEDAQTRHGLLNFAAWPDNPTLAEPGHRSAILSLACLSLATPGVGRLLAPDAIRRKHLRDGVTGIGRHVANIAAGLPDALDKGARFLHGRFVGQPRLPGFFIRNKAHRYTLLYHTEQAPNPTSTVALTESRDALGVPRLRIDLRYGELDARSIVSCHAIIDRNLRTAGIGRLDYAVPEPERIASILEQATDGFHQIGTTRMSADPRSGVVDADCRVHGTPNLFVVSSSVFPTSGQANPTLLVAALSARLAAHLARSLGQIGHSARAA